MRKAFDANVPKLRPRLKANAEPAAASELLPLGEAAAPAPTAPPTSSPSGMADDAAVHPEPFDRLRAGSAPPEAARGRRAPASTAGPAAAHASRGAPPPPAPEARSNELLDRKDRLDKIKRKVAEASRPTARPGPAPADPARAAESVLGLVRDLEEELVRAREREEALRTDLDEARRELGRTASDGRAAAERLDGAEKELEEKRAVLAELLEEMKALEDERDESVRRAQALAALDEERARLLEEVSRRAEEEAKLRAEREEEVERLSEELRAGAQDGARLRAAVGELARERDQLAAEVDRARTERDDLAAAKRALEQVHAALAQARARLG